MPPRTIQPTIVMQKKKNTVAGHRPLPEARWTVSLREGGIWE